MKKYIDFNTEKKTNAANDIKLIIMNSAYWKTMEHLQKRTNVRLENNAEVF